MVSPYYLVVCGKQKKLYERATPITTKWQLHQPAYALSLISVATVAQLGMGSFSSDSL